MKREMYYSYWIVGVPGSFESLKEARKMYRFYLKQDLRTATQIWGATAMHDRTCPELRGRYIYRMNLMTGTRAYFKP